jgi:hypothetical protein
MGTKIALARVGPEESELLDQLAKLPYRQNAAVAAYASAQVSLP